MSPVAAIAHYRIFSKLGKGGMGEMWRATDTKLNRDNCHQVSAEVICVDPDRRARFSSRSVGAGIAELTQHRGDRTRGRVRAGNGACGMPTVAETCTGVQR